MKLMHDCVNEITPEEVYRIFRACISGDVVDQDVSSSLRITFLVNIWLGTGANKEKAGGYASIFSSLNEDLSVYGH